MSRIRSIHPGLWTDVEFVGLSPFARLLFIGIWNECDDKGTFVWSPLQLKMRLLPADSVDAGALLAEIEQSGSIRRYEVAGKTYGAVKNFTKFQRPKKPNAINPLPAEIAIYCGASSEAKADEETPGENKFPTDGEISPQMEEGGGIGEEEPIGSTSPPPPKSKSSLKIPDWVPAEQWAAFLEMRKRKRAVPTARAIKLLIDNLDELRRAGHDPGAVLDQSTRKSWTDVYEIKDQKDGRYRNNRNGAPNHHGGRDNRDGFKRACDDWIDEAGRSATGGNGAGGQLALGGPDSL